MNIDWVNFTPYAALSGGALIGLATAALLLLNGRIAGISGILGGLLHGAASDRSWRVAFLGGMMLAPWMWQCFFPLPSADVNASPMLLIVAGLLVGLGSRFGSGCTSGHGVCGLARFSLRSLVATASFIGAGMVTVFVMRHVWGMS